MFRLIFISRFKCIIRDRQMMFWTFFFPILLSTLFGMAFQNINKGVAFTKIPIAVVDNAEFKKETAFQTALASVSG
ncbi:MAG: ABC transporter permease, partial [Clostridia bacterium]|nr:ABC transporter permease [Clostridia bacterium]